jgi:aminomethyltransferase
VADPEDLLETPLAGLHRQFGGRMVPFAGYSMPVQFPAGIMAEHLHCRSSAALFDVSHMGQAELRGEGAATALEKLTPADVAGLKPGRQRYGLLLNDAGGIVDDFMVANLGDRLFLVVNASRKGVDFPLIESVLPTGVTLRPLPDRALLALQGPAVAALVPAALTFMGIAEIEIAGIRVLASRSGYTGEDGLEISVPAEQAEALARHLLDLPGVMAAGLGARIRCGWSRALPLRPGPGRDHQPGRGRAHLVDRQARPHVLGLPGADAVREALDKGPSGLRVGLRPEGRQPARAHTPIQADGAVIGEVTSGGFGPSVGAPVAMGYVGRAHAGDAPRSTSWCATRPCPHARPPCPSSPTATPDRSHVHAEIHQDHEWCGWMARRPPSASPTTHRTRLATWCSWTCLSPAAWSRRVRPSPWWKA